MQPAAAPPSPRSTTRSTAVWGGSPPLPTCCVCAPHARPSATAWACLGWDTSKCNVQYVRLADQRHVLMSTSTVPIGWFGNLAGDICKAVELQLEKLTGDREVVAGAVA